jgi:hypothetical protein
MSVLSQFGGGAIKQVYRGISNLGLGTYSATPMIGYTGTLEARMLGWSSTSSTVDAGSYPMVYFSGGNLTVSRNNVGGGLVSVQVSWEVTEYY